MTAAKLLTRSPRARSANVCHLVMVNHRELLLHEPYAQRLHPAGARAGLRDGGPDIKLGLGPTALSRATHPKHLLSDRHCVVKVLEQGRDDLVAAREDRTREQQQGDDQVA